MRLQCDRVRCTDPNLYLATLALLRDLAGMTVALYETRARHVAKLRAQLVAQRATRLLFGATVRFRY